METGAWRHELDIPRCVCGLRMGWSHLRVLAADACRALEATEITLLKDFLRDHHPSPIHLLYSFL